MLAVNSVCGECLESSAESPEIKGACRLQAGIRHILERAIRPERGPRNLPLGFSHWLTPFQGAWPQEATVPTSNGLSPTLEPQDYGTQQLITPDCFYFRVNGQVGRVGSQGIPGVGKALET